MRVTDTGRRDAIEQRIQVARRVELLDGTGEVTERHELDFELRYIYKPEMELLLRAAGFARFEARAGYADKPAREEGDNLIWTAWKN